MRDPYSRELPKFAVYEVIDTRDGPEFRMVGSADTYEELVEHYSSWIAGAKYWWVELKIIGRLG